MKQNCPLILISLLICLVTLTGAFSFGIVSAQNAGYNVDRINHQVQVLYSGSVVILEEIHISGKVTDGFAVGLPLKYSASVLKALAYDDTHNYQVSLGVQGGGINVFYGAQVNFGGSAPNVFTVAFVLSNSLISEKGEGVSELDFPAYPSLEQSVGTCVVSLSFPASPTSISITKDDGTINDATYTKTTLPAYTTASATASYKLPNGFVQLTTISSLDRTVKIEPTGKVQVFDDYKIINNSTSLLNSFVISLPNDATAVVVKDQFGKLTTSVSTSQDGKLLLANATLNTFLSNGQSTVLIAQYDLPQAKLEGSDYVLSNFKLFPDFQYYVDKATLTFTPPEGATIVNPKASLLDSFSTLTRQTYQDTLTLTKSGLSYIDYIAPQQNTIEFSFNYNPVWVALRPTFWVSIAAAIGCIVVFFVRKQKPKEETYADKTERLATLETTGTPTESQAKISGLKTGRQVTAEDIKEFTEAYDDKKQLKSELKAMDAKAQKGKIPRRQYKIQRRAIETRLDGINRNIQRTKGIFQSSTGPYADLVKQLDLAEADLADAEENIRILESKQNKGEISIEAYKRSIQDYQKQKDKAESGINGILLRLREKIR